MRPIINPTHRYAMNLHKQLHLIFGKLGRGSARAPWRLAIGALLCACTVSLGLLFTLWEDRIEYSYTPRHLPAFKIFEQEIALFGPKPRLAELTMVVADGLNILEKAQLKRAMRVHDAVLGITVDGDALARGEIVRFEDVCERVYVGGPCMLDNALVRTGLEEMREFLDDMDQETIDAFLISQASVLKAYLGDLRVDKKAGTIRAGSMRFLYFLANVAPNGPKLLIAPKSAAETRVLAWEKGFIDFCNQPARSDADVDVAHGFALSGVAVRSINDEVARNVRGSISFMIGACVIIFAVMAFWLRSLILGACGLVTILLAILAGLGLVGLLGVPLTDISLMVRTHATVARLRRAVARCAACAAAPACGLRTCAGKDRWRDWRGGAAAGSRRPAAQTAQSCARTTQSRSARASPLSLSRARRTPSRCAPHRLCL